MNLSYDAAVKIVSGCSRRLSSKAAASEEARRTLLDGEPRREARTTLANSFSRLLVVEDDVEEGTVYVQPAVVIQEA